MSQQVVGHVGGTRRTIRWAAVNESPWIHAEDLCNALGWQRPERTLCALQSNVAVASALGIQIGSADDRYVDRAGVMELCARRTGGQTQGVKNLVLAKYFMRPLIMEATGNVSTWNHKKNQCCPPRRWWQWNSSRDTALKRL